MEYKGINNPKLTCCVSPENESLCVKMEWKHLLLL